MFQILVKDILKERFRKEWEKLVTIEPLLFGSFVPCCYPNGDTKQKPYQDVYCEITDRPKLKSVCDNMLEDFNSMNPSKKMNLVLFLSALEHIVKINRVITTEFGHALLMGVGGSGRKSLSALAIFIATFDSFEIEITKSYDFLAWRDDMRQRLFM
jgi:dynein heavy chain